jgi:hypothetical protein
VTLVKMVPPGLREEVVSWCRRAYERDGVVPSTEAIGTFTSTVARDMGLSWDNPRMKWIQGVRREASMLEEVAAQPTR